MKDKKVQSRLLDECMNVVKQQGWQMRRSLDEGDLREALKHCSAMVSELKTSGIPPKDYYQLYMLMFEEIKYLAEFLTDESRFSRSLVDLYDVVQQAGNILPRLYLMITVGSCLVKSNPSSTKRVLQDITELCKGVQHPMRGLFLRYYLIQTCKDKLPDTGSRYEMAGGGDVLDAFNFLYENFKEAANLWIRLQNQHNAWDVDERYQLRILVGAYLVRMSELEGMTKEMYASRALPSLLEFILETDHMAQQYLLDCIIQVFSDDYHLYTLETLLDSCLKSSPQVDLKLILGNLMKRLSNFISSEEAVIPEGLNVFEVFFMSIQQIIKRNESLPAYATVQEKTSFPYLLELLSSFLAFTLALNPDRVDYVDIIMCKANELLNSQLSQSERLSGPVVNIALELLSLPLRQLELSSLNLNHFSNLMSFLNSSTKQMVAISMIEAVIGSKTPLNDLNALKGLLGLIAPLYSKEKETSKQYNEEEPEQPPPSMSDEIFLLSKLIHRIKTDDFDQRFVMYQCVYSTFERGKNFTAARAYSAIVFCSIQLIKDIMKKKKQFESLELKSLEHTVTYKKILQFIYIVCTALVPELPEIAFRLLLQSAIVTDELDAAESDSYAEICYEFFVQSMICFEDGLSHTKSRFQAIVALVGVLCHNIECLSTDNYQYLATKVTQHSAQLFKKHDQCRAILLCSNLFWNNQSYRDTTRVLECLQKCLKTADSELKSEFSTEMFLEILDKYIYYFSQKNELITAEFIQNLIALCAEHIKYSWSAMKPASIAYFHNIITFIKSKRDSGLEPRYAGIIIEDDLVNIGKPLSPQATADQSL